MVDTEFVAFDAVRLPDADAASSAGVETVAVVVVAVSAAAVSTHSAEVPLALKAL